MRFSLNILGFVFLCLAACDDDASLATDAEAHGSDGSPEVIDGALGLLDGGAPLVEPDGECVLRVSDDRGMVFEQTYPLTVDQTLGWEGPNW